MSSYLYTPNHIFQQMQHLMSTRQLNESKYLIECILEECVKPLAASSKSQLIWSLASQDKSDLVFCLLIPYIASNHTVQHKNQKKLGIKQDLESKHI